MPTCQIRWVNDKGEPTPDTNEAIGIVYREAYVWIGPDGRGHQFPQTENFHICAKHAEQLNNRGMEHWKLERF